MSDDMEFISGASGGEFLDRLAVTLAQHVNFDNHGKLSVDEQKAFVWGFRHGVHHMRDMLGSASRDGNSDKAIGMIMDMVTQACRTWDIHTHAQVRLQPIAEGNETAH